MISVSGDIIDPMFVYVYYNIFRIDVNYATSFNGLSEFPTARPC